MLPTEFAPGDPVIARGSVVAVPGTAWITPGESRLLGRPEPDDPDLRTPPKLDDGPGAVLHGLDPTSLPRWTQWSRFGFSGAVEVRGRWTGAAIEVTAVEPYEPDPDLNALDCDERIPPQGLQPVDEADYQQARIGLESIVFGNWHDYAGDWPRRGPGRVLVVGTIGDPFRAQAKLASVFPYALCVRPVEFSQADLNAAETRIAADHPGWAIRPVYGLNRVIVPVSYLSEVARGLVRSYPAAVPWPLVRPAPPD